MCRAQNPLRLMSGAAARTPASVAVGQRLGVWMVWAKLPISRSLDGVGTCVGGGEGHEKKTKRDTVRSVLFGRS